MQQFGRELRAAAQAAQQTGDTTQVDRLAASYEGARKNVAALQGQIRSLNREVAGTGSAMQAANQHFAEMNTNVSALGASLAAMATRMRNFGTVVAASVASAAVAMGKLATSAAKSLDDLDDMASATGTTTQDIEKLQLAATKAGDQGFESINKALERTTKAMGQARIEAQKNTHTIELLNGKVRDFSNPFEAVGVDPRLFKDSISLLEAWARGLERIRDPSIKAAIAADLLGKNWARVLPTIKDLRAEMEQAEKNIVAGGGFTSEQSIEAAGRFQAALGKLEAQFGRIRNAAGAQLGAALVPAIEQLSQFISQNMQQISAWIVNAAGYIRALTQDFVKFLTTGETTGFRTEWAQAIINAFLYIQNTLIPGLIAAFNAVMVPLNGLADAVNAVFGTKMSGGDIGLALVIGQISGAFGVMTTAINLVAAAFVVLAPILGPAGWIIAGCIALNTILLTLTGSWGDLTNAIKKAWDTIAGFGSDFWEKLKLLGSRIAGAPAPVGGGPAGMARGGLVPGRGVGDTVPAWLTPGEFVIRKSVVGSLGADFFAQLNRGMGGLLPRNQYATGGIVVGDGGGGTPVHLHIGNQSFPLSGNENVVSALVVEAHRQHVRSAGVKPSWYGGR